MDNVQLKSDSVSVTDGCHNRGINEILPDDELYEAIMERLYGESRPGFGLCYEF